MVRPRKKIPNNTKEKIKEALGELTIANQITPLMFDRDHMAILLSLKHDEEAGGLPFTGLGDVTNLGTSQKLVDTLNHLMDYGFVEKINGNYSLTEFGVSASDFAERFIKMINSDPDIASQSKLAGNISIIQSVTNRHEEYLKKKAKGTL